MEKENDIDDGIIVRYLEGTISEEEMAQLEQWLSESESHKKLFLELKHIDELHQTDELPANFASESWRRLEPKLLMPRRTMRLNFLKYAAVAVVAIAVTLGVQRLFQKEPVIQSTIINTEEGAKISSMLLPDGTKVTLNKASQLRYDTQFGKKTRTVYLNGEALFEVTKNKKKPFVVYTQKQRIEVLGTVFNVQDYADEDYATTTLIKGSVKMQSLNADGQYGKFIFLKPNQQVLVDFLNKQSTVSTVDIDSTKSWVNKFLYFDDDPLYHILQRLEKTYGVKIELKNQAIRDTRYSGSFTTDQSIKDVLDIINYDKQFAMTMKNNKIFIN
jgi:transmembrane sensor